MVCRWSPLLGQVLGPEVLGRELLAFPLLPVNSPLRQGHLVGSCREQPSDPDCECQGAWCCLQWRRKSFLNFRASERKGTSSSTVGLSGQPKVTQEGRSGAGAQALPASLFMGPILPSSPPSYQKGVVRTPVLESTLRAWGTEGPSGGTLRQHLVQTLVTQRRPRDSCQATLQVGVPPGLEAKPLSPNPGPLPVL